MPRATVIIPTHRRAQYLDVALASIVPQARAPARRSSSSTTAAIAATQAVARRHGADLLVLEPARGLNAARNAAAAGTDAELLVLRRRRRPGPPRLAAPRCSPRTSASPGRRRPHRPDPGALRGPRVPDLRPRGPADHVPRPRARTTPTRPTPGARTWRCAAARSSASGRSTSRWALYGDEQEWQMRLLAAGGRIRYVAGAALDHRRAGDDARLRSLARAACAAGGRAAASTA